MKKERAKMQISLSIKDVYIALQSIIEAQERMSENDIQTVMNASFVDLEDLANRLRDALKMD